jgi:AcrR family transcriptional regulator
MARPPKISNDDILAAARQVFLAQGMGASTLEIAELAGISEASIFKRFGTKQALFLAAIGITETPQWIKAISSKEPTAKIEVELTEICREMLAFYLKVLPRVMMMMAPGSLPPLMKSPPPPIRDSQVIAKFLARAIDLGYLRPSDPQTIAHMLVGAINNYTIAHTISTAVPESETIDPDRFITQLIDTIWSGIAPET